MTHRDLTEELKNGIAKIALKENGAMGALKAVFGVRAYQICIWKQRLLKRMVTKVH